MFYIALLCVFHLAIYREPPPNVILLETDSLARSLIGSDDDEDVETGASLI
jgi:hypothetical protein